MSEVIDRVFNILYENGLRPQNGLQPLSYVELSTKVTEEVTLELGRECMELGIVPFLTKLVGEDNTTRLFERHAGEA